MCLPGLNGVELYRSFVRHHPNTVFILMTGHEDDRHVRDALAEGARLVLFKPVSIARLLKEAGPAPTP